MPSNLLWSALSNASDAVPLIVKASVSNVPSTSTLPEISNEANVPTPPVIFPIVYVRSPVLAPVNEPVPTTKASAL